MNRARWTRAGALVVGLLASGQVATLAQLPSSIGNDRMAWMLSNLRPAGQPVIPIFEGWYAKEDGSSTLCFGYYSLNTEEAVDIPLGADNFIEPARFDGVQPTHFSEVPPEHRRHFCVFTVELPSDFGTADVTWTLRIGGQSYSVPGHTTSDHYQIEEPVILSRDLAAPVLAFVAPLGPEGKGRGGELMVGASATGDRPLALTIALSRTGGEPLGRLRILWDKHQGPGDVSFTESDVQIREDQQTRLETSTSATFGAPGEYVLRVQAVDWTRGNPFGFQCCWTNGYVRVTVSP